MDDDVQKEFERISQELEVIRDCLRVVKPIVVEYYSKKSVEGRIGYE